MRSCSKCKVEKPLEDFSKRRVGIDGLDPKCKECRAEYNQIWYSKNKKRRNLKVAANVTRRRQRVKAIIDSLKDYPCLDCKQKFPPCAMDFDHVKGKKLFNIAAISSGNWGEWRLMDEIKKCELVCANCHRVRTFNRTRSTTVSAVAR